MTVKSIIGRNAATSLVLCAAICALAYMAYRVIGESALKERLGGVYTVLTAGVFFLLAAWLLVCFRRFMDYKAHPSYIKFSRIPGSADSNEKELDALLAQAGDKKRDKHIALGGWEIDKGLFRTVIRKTGEIQN